MSIPANPRRAKPIEDKDTGTRGRIYTLAPGEPSPIVNPKQIEATRKADEESLRQQLIKDNEAKGGTPIAPKGSVFGGVTGREIGLKPGPASIPANPSGETFAQTEARDRREKNLSGAFGTRAQNLEQRKGLFAEMKAGTVTQDAARERATSLGVTPNNFDSASARAVGVDTGPPASAAAPAPLTGRALAEKNLATMGTLGAIADYRKRDAAEKQKRDAAEKAAMQNRKDNAFKNNFVETANRPAEAPNKTFSQTFGITQDDAFINYLEAQVAELEQKDSESSKKNQAMLDAQPLTGKNRGLGSTIYDDELMTLKEAKDLADPSRYRTPWRNKKVNIEAMTTSQPAETPTPTTAVAPVPEVKEPTSSAYKSGKSAGQFMDRTVSSVQESMRGPDYSLPENAPSFTNAMEAKPIKFNSFKRPELSDEIRRTFRPAANAARDFLTGFRNR